MDYKEKYIKYKTKYLFMKNNYLLNNNEENSLNSSNSFIEQSGGDNIKYSKLYVFNRLYQIIEIISYNKFDNKIHISIDDDKLVKLSKINYKKIINTIKLQPKYKLKYFHTSNREISYPITDKNKDMSSWLGDGIYKSPKGLWFSCGESWQKFIRNVPNPWSLATYIYELEPSQTVLKISSKEELENFIKKYQKDNIKITDIINWKKVKKDYDGLIICPYLGNIIWGKKANNFGIWGHNDKINEYIKKVAGNKWKKDIYFTAEWYRHFEEGTGIIWKPSTGLKNITLLKKLNTYESFIK